MQIRKITGIDPTDNASVAKAFEQIEPQAIACCNWPKEFAYAPQVCFRMFHTGEHLMLRFDVAEGYTAALVTEDNGEVWTDSCVEFFLALDDTGYYNFETTCIGRMLLGFRKTHDDAVHAGPEIMQQVLRTASLGSKPFPEREGDNRWSVVLAIPPSALFRHKVGSWNDVEARVNLYKCGDKLSHPHFLSWKPIRTEKPNFHKPEFFEPIKFTR